MATEHDPRASDAPIQPGSVPRHASAKERKGRGLRPFLSDLKAEVQNQLSRAEVPARDTHGTAGGETQSHATQVVYPAAPPQPPAETAPGAPPPPQADHAGALATAALATAGHAEAEAATARADAAAAHAEAEAAHIEAEAARAEAAAARGEAAVAQTTAARADTQLQAARAEIEAAHREFEALRAQVDADREHTRRHILIAWIAAAAATLLATLALILGS